MSVNHIISDAIASIKNAIAVRKDSLTVPFSSLLLNVVEKMKDNGFIDDFSVQEDGNKRKISIELKYVDSISAINRINVCSTPGRRNYKNVSEINRKLSGVVVYILSTNQGVLTAKEAVAQNVGGELLCEIF
jgi:small subunit ribosomal protein S8